MEISKSARWSATRWSTPSYRPQMRIRCSSPASRRASRWVNSSPWGERRTPFPGRARMLWSSGPEKIPGKSVRMSIRTLPPLRGGHHDAAARDVHLADKLGNHRKEGLPLFAPDDEPVVSRPLLHPDELPDPPPPRLPHFAPEQ